MIVVTTKTSKSGTRLVVRNRNGNPFNHAYNKPGNARAAWKAFVKQVKEDKVILK